ncbi:MAG: murein hydrolase activator EnvC family protein [Actinomycetes bacterium]
MSRRPARPLRALLVLLASALVPATAVAQDIEQVEEQVEELETRVADATAAYEDVWARVNAAEAELEDLEARTAALEERAAEVADALGLRAREAFKRGADTVLTSMLTAEGPAGAVERASLMAAVTERDEGSLEQATALRTQAAQARILLDRRREELAVLRDELDARRVALESDLSSARDRLSSLERIEARKRTINRGAQNGTYACIFDRPFNFRDTWGAPRSGGRSHKGTDVFSFMDAPTYAFTSGRISRITNSRLGGLGIYLFGDDGNEYYYAHINGVAPGIGVGSRVDAGQLIAFNGDTGNARGGPPHVHFENHPGGGAAINPYPWLAAACF